MEQRVIGIQNHNKVSELVWLLEHPPLYTAGTSANMKDILDSSLCPVYQTGRGGQVTYHGPGQRLAYVMLDLQQRNPDIRAYVFALEQWLINTLDEFGIEALRRKGRIGLWVVNKRGQDNKIAAIGVRVKKWVTLHGVALNVHPDLSYYKGIVPCGIRDHGVTSMHDLGICASMAEVDQVLYKHFALIFGPTIPAQS